MVLVCVNRFISITKCNWGCLPWNIKSFAKILPDKLGI